jgi:tetratricopeptide (TPR) repeat protein
MDTRLLRIELLLGLDKKEESLAAANQLLSEYPSEHFALFIRSEIEARQGYVESAIESISRYLEAVPNDPRGLYRRAQFYVVETNWPAAIKDLETLKTRDPDALEFRPRILLADAYSRINKNDLATLELETILKSEPDQEEVANQLLRLYYRSDELSKCRQVLTSLINIYKDDPKWLGMRGEISLRMNHTADALADFRKGAEMSHYDPRYTRFVLDYYKDTKAHAKGIAYFENEIPPSAQHATIRYRYAHMLARTGKTQQAVEEYRTSAREAGAGSEAFLSIIVKDASEVFGGDKSVSVFRDTPVRPENERSNDILIAFLEVGHGKIEDAVKNINSLLSTSDTKKEQILLNTLLYMCFDRKRDYSAAREVCEDVLRIDPENPLALNNIAYQLAENLNDPDTALDYAKRAVRAQPSNANIIDTLGWVYVQQKNYDNAIGELNRAVGLKPNFVEARWHLGEAYRRKGDYQQAIQQFKDALALMSESGVDTHMRRKVEDSLNMATAMLGGG